METDAGVTGLGEVGIGGWRAAVDQAVKHLGEVLVGEPRRPDGAFTNW